MNGAIANTLIGVTGGGVIALVVLFIRITINRFDRLEEKFEGSLIRLEAKFESGFIRLEEKFEGQVDRLEKKSDGKFDRVEEKFDNLVGEVHALEIRLVDKFTAQLKEHGERLARIEAKLEVDPPAEAA